MEIKILRPKERRERGLKEKRVVSSFKRRFVQNRWAGRTRENSKGRKYESSSRNSGNGKEGLGNESAKKKKSFSLLLHHNGGGRD